MQFRGKGLTFIECAITVVIVTLFFVIVFPVVTGNEVDFRGENINSNLSELHEQTGAYRRDHGRKFQRGKSLEVQMTSQSGPAGNLHPSRVNLSQHPSVPVTQQSLLNSFADAKIGNSVTAELGSWSN